MARNPFRFNRHVNPEKFLGRDHLVTQIVNDLFSHDGDSYGIVGGRRFGKSSLLRAIEYNLLKQSIFLTNKTDCDISDPTDITLLPVFISLKSLDPSTPEDVFGLISHRIKKSVCGKKSNIPNFPGPILELGLPKDESNSIKPTTLQNLENEIEQIISAAHIKFDILLRVTLLIDEVDAILDFPWTNSVLGMFRHLIYDSDTRAYIRLVFAGSNRYLFVNEKGSPLLNAVISCYLNPFDDSGTNKLISMAGDLTPEVATLVALQGGGHPFILQHLLHYLFQNGANLANQDSVNLETRRFIYDRAQDIDNWWYAIGEDGRKVYIILAKSQSWMSIAELRETNPHLSCNFAQGVKALCFHGLAKHDGTYRNYCISGDLFLDWVINTKGLDIDSPTLLEEATFQLSDTEKYSISPYNGKPPESTNSLLTPEKDREKTAKLRNIVQVIKTRFDREEFRTLCFNIGLNYDLLTPGGLEAQAIQLVMSCDKANYLENLTQEIKRLRSFVNFDDMSA